MSEKEHSPFETILHKIYENEKEMFFTNTISKFTVPMLTLFLVYHPILMQKNFGIKMKIKERRKGTRV